MRTFNEWLTANGFDPESVSANELQKLSLQAAWRASEQGDAKPVNPVAAANAGTPVGAQPAQKAADDGFAATMQAIESENDRIGYIRSSTVQLCKEYVGDSDRVKQIRALCDSAVADQSVNKQRWDLELMRHTRGISPNVFVPSTPQVTADVLEAAVCQSAGLKGIEQVFDARTLEAAHKKFKGGIGLQELIGEAAKSHGFRGSVGRDLRGAMKAVQFGEMQATGGFAVSTYDLSGILANVANKFVRESFMYVESEWRKITAIRSVRDYKAITTYAVTGDMKYEKLAPGGEIRHGTLSSESYTNQADLYAKMIGLDHRDLVNDDLGALSVAARRLGRGAALKLNEVFWTAFLNNASFFTSGRGNYDDGTDTAFSADGLAAADAIWSAMTDPDGHPLGSKGAILLVPPKFRVAAMKLMGSQTINAADEEGVLNPWAGMFEVVSSVYLANSTISGYSTDAWYILSDPRDVPVMEVVFLNGQESPTIESSEMDFNRMGIGFRGYHAFGAALQEYRGGLKLKGTV